MAEQKGTEFYQSPYKFNGKELDQETGLYYYGARYYDPRASIWLSVDPLAEMQLNKTPYHYCSNNPVKRIDPIGMIDEDSTHTDRDGNVIAVVKDGDKGVYKHENAKKEKDVLDLRAKTNPALSPLGAALLRWWHGC